ncbi:MAG: hypothetical protein JO356_03815, partial [Acidobacteria bacterium]|nr:hypothetical protein [Acidobacteriota bacterium]
MRPLSIELSLSRRLPVKLSSKKFLLWSTLMLAFCQAQPALLETTHGIRLADMDRSVKPGNDFYRFCNGAWIAHTEIPADRPRMSTFSTLQEVSEQRT